MDSPACWCLGMRGSVLRGLGLELSGVGSSTVGQSPDRVWTVGGIGTHQGGLLQEHQLSAGKKSVTFEFGCFRLRPARRLIILRPALEEFVIHFQGFNCRGGGDPGLADGSCRTRHRDAERAPPHPPTTTNMLGAALRIDVFLRASLLHRPSMGHPGPSMLHPRIYVNVIERDRAGPTLQLTRSVDVDRAGIECWQ